MNLGEGIRKAIAKLSGKVIIDEKAVKELIKEIQRVLISNDVNVNLVFEVSKKIEERALKEKKPPGISLKEHIIRVVYEEMEKLVGGAAYTPEIKKQRILLLGLYGSGKTTTAGKLAKFYSKRGLNVLLVPGDVHRPAAYEQLEQIAKKAGVSFLNKREKDAEKISKEAKFMKKYDVIIFDSSGRNAFDKELKNELKKVSKEFEPDKKILVVSADIGQVAGKQAEEFDSAVGIDGVIVTKMDGSGKGGGALSSVAASKSKILFIGTGEKLNDIEAFDAKKFAAVLLGFPDLKALIEKVKEIDKEEELEKALKEGKLDYEIFLTQMKSMKKMGPMKKVLQMLGVYDLPEELVGKSEEQIKHIEAAVLSMTPEERKNTNMMKEKSRQERVAKGSGNSIKEVKELTKNFEKMAKLTKMLKDKNAIKKVWSMLGKIKKIK